MKLSWATWILVIIWGSTLIAGYCFLVDYHLTPGDQSSNSPTQWPSRSLELKSDAPTLVVAVHPQCWCTRASLVEIQRILTLYKKNLHVYALVYSPKEHEQDPSWGNSFTMNALNNLSNVTIIQDIEGAQAQVFHLLTSGHTQLYNPSGQLLFSGGVTESRGHEGKNRSTDKILTLLHGEASTLQESPVFGCPLCSPQIDKKEEL